MEKKRYFAFISYSHKDSELAKWLQHEFEYYELPATLFDERKDLHKEDLPESFKPVFRDEDELAGGDLKPQISEALADSEYLIVVCSPNSAHSIYVDNEIKEFISLSQENKRRIFPFIVDGKPHSKDNSIECFPKTLLKLSEDKKDPIELIAGDIHATGRDHAFVKILAGTLNEKDIRFADLWNRYAIEKAEKERQAREDKEKLQIAQSRFLAEKANQLVDEGDSYMARLLALKALPKDLGNPDRPYVAEAEAALRNAVGHNSAILRGHHNVVKSAMFSPNGDYILSLSEDKTIRAWSTLDASCINTYPHEALAAHFFPKKGNTVFTFIMKRCLQIWDVAQNNLLDSKNVDFYHEKLFCFSQDGTRLYSISVGEYNLIIWDIERGERIKSIQKDEFKSTNCMAVSNDGRLLACGAKDVIRLYDLLTENLLITYQQPHEYINRVAFNHTGDLIASSTWKTISLWNSSEAYITRNANTVTDKCIKTFSKDNHDRDVLSLFFSSDGQELISASQDHHIKIWDIDTETCGTLQGHIHDVNSVLLSSDNSLILSASSDNTIRLWDYRQRPAFRIFPLEKNTIEDYSTFSPKCDFIAVANGNIARLLDVKTRECIRPFEGHEGEIAQLVYSPLGDTLLTTSWDETIRLWRIETDDSRILDKAMDSSFFITFSRDGKMCATGGKTDGGRTFVKIWNTEKIWDKGRINEPFKIIYYDNKDFITNATFSCDNEYIIALGYYGTLYEFKVNNGSEDYYSWKISDSNIELVGNLITPSNEHIIYTTGIGDQIYIWDRKNQTHKNPLSGHTNCIKSINLNSDGTLIVSASMDKTIKVWDVESGVCLKTLHGHTDEVVNAVFTDDEHIISVSRDNTIIEWEYPSLKQLINDTCDRFKNRELTEEERMKYYLE